MKKLAPEGARPPLGLRPQWLADEMYNSQRLIEVMDAIARYTEADYPVPIEWLNEYNQRAAARAAQTK